MSRYSLLCLIALCFASLASGAAIADPVGDTFGSGPVEIDITSIDAVAAAGTLTFTLTFANTISPASAAAANSIFGFIDIDVDRNPSTGGGGSNQATFGIAPSPLLNDEFFLDLGSEASHPGLVDVVNAVTFATAGTAPIAYLSNSLSMGVPYSLIGSSTGLVNYGVVVGTASEPTDEAVNGAGFATNAVPEPGTITLLGLALLSVAAGKRLGTRI